MIATHVLYCGADGGIINSEDRTYPYYSCAITQHIRLFSYQILSDCLDITNPISLDQLVITYFKIPICTC